MVSASYLQMCYSRLVRGNLAPGQETSVRAMRERSLQDIIQPRTFDKSLGGHALAQRTSDVVVPFPVDGPTSFILFTSTPVTFEHLRTLQSGQSLEFWWPLWLQSPAQIEVGRRPSHCSMQTEAKKKTHSRWTRLRLCGQGEAKNYDEEPNCWMAVRHRSAKPLDPCRQRTHC